MPTNINTIAPADNFGSPVRKPEEFENKRLIIHGVTWTRGNFGDYAIVRCSIREDSEVFEISTGATVVMQQLEAVEHAAAFPLEASFRRRGRMWRLE